MARVITRKAQRLLELHKAHVQRLTVLEVQCARYGIDTPAHIQVEIQDIKRELAGINAKFIKATSGQYAIFVPDETDGAESRTLVVGAADLKVINAEEAINQRPPESAEYLLWYLPKGMREPVMGDLEEEFQLVFKRFGRQRAVRWYYWQVAASFWPFAAGGVKRLAKWTAMGWIGEALRRLIP